ncbi:MAG: hypothetical protein M3340_18000 [Actinomycetota bacterium]|nr:hypothetical protein [Actinomycetota bacterium]
MVGAAPYLVFGSNFRDAATDPRWELVYLVSGWGPFFLMTVGALCFVPVVVSMHRSGYSRLYLRPVTRHAWLAWGLVTYLLGFCLGVQTAQIAGLF